MCIDTFFHCSLQPLNKTLSSDSEHILPFFRKPSSLEPHTFQFFLTYPHFPFMLRTWFWCMFSTHRDIAPRHPLGSFFFLSGKCLDNASNLGKAAQIPWKCQLKSTFQELIPQEVSYIYIIINKNIHLGWLHVCLANQKLHPASEGGRRENRGTRSKGFSEFTNLRKGGPLNYIKLSPKCAAFCQNCLP